MNMSCVLHSGIFIYSQLKKILYMVTNLSLTVLFGPEIQLIHILYDSIAIWPNGCVLLLLLLLFMSVVTFKYIYEYSCIYEYSLNIYKYS